MTKKHYIALANAVKGYRLDNIKHINANLADDTPVIMAHGFLNALCDILEADNPAKFNKSKFLEACK